MTDILMPALSPTMEEGVLAKWHVKVGDRIVDLDPSVARLVHHGSGEGRFRWLHARPGRARALPIRYAVSLWFVSGCS